MPSTEDTPCISISDCWHPTFYTSRKRDTKCLIVPRCVENFIKLCAIFSIAYRRAKGKRISKKRQGRTRQKSLYPIRLRARFLHSRCSVEMTGGGDSSDCAEKTGLPKIAGDAEFFVNREQNAPRQAAGRIGMQKSFKCRSKRHSNCQRELTSRRGCAIPSL